MKKLVIPTQDKEPTSELENVSLPSLEEMLTDSTQSIELNEIDLNNELNLKLKKNNASSVVVGLEQFKEVKLKDRVESSDSLDFTSYTENPITSVAYDELDIELETMKFSPRKSLKKKNTIIYTRNMVLALVMVCLLSISVGLNSFFLSSLDPVLMNIISMPYRLTVSAAGAINGFFYNFAVKPYVVTVGEYGNLAVAKDAAVDLLPKFKQINIIELDSGIYSFEIHRFSSKKKAYATAKEFLKNDLDSVHVRYLPAKK